MAEAVRFELTEHFCSTVFKTAALSRAQPHFQLGGLLYSPNLEYLMLQLSPILTSNRGGHQL